MAGQLTAPFDVAMAWASGDTYKADMDYRDTVYMALTDGRIALSGQITDYVSDPSGWRATGPALVLSDGVNNASGSAAGSVLLASPGATSSDAGAWSTFAVSSMQARFLAQFGGRRFRLYLDAAGRELLCAPCALATTANGADTPELSGTLGYEYDLWGFSWELLPSPIAQSRAPRAATLTSVYLDTTEALRAVLNLSALTTRAYTLNLMVPGASFPVKVQGARRVIEVIVAPADVITLPASGTEVTSYLTYSLQTPSVVDESSAAVGTYTVPAGITKIWFSVTGDSSTVTLHTTDPGN